jgi:hypothetical protein
MQCQHQPTAGGTAAASDHSGATWLAVVASQQCGYRHWLSELCDAWSLHHRRLSLRHSRPHLDGLALSDQQGYASRAVLYGCEAAHGWNGRSAVSEDVQHGTVTLHEGRYRAAVAHFWGLDDPTDFRGR